MKRLFWSRFLLRFKQGAFFFRQKCIIPLQENEDAARREYILNVLLVWSVVVSGVTAAVSVFDLVQAGATYGGVPPIFIIGIFFTFSGLLLLSRFGYTRLSATFLIGLYLVPVLYASIRWGADLPQAVAVYALLIIMCGVLLGARFAVLFTALMSFFLLGVTYLQATGALSLVSYWRKDPFTVPDAVVMIVTFGITSVVAWLSSNEIEKSLYRAHASEQALKEERDSLEAKVDERTRELRRSQIEHMGELHRFIEFGRLASGLFHDLSSPLTALSINLEMLEQEKKRGESAVHLKNALKTTDRLQSFLQSVKRQMQSRSEKTTFTVRDALEKVVELTAYKAKKHNVTIDIICAKNLEIYADLIKFDQVFMNLLTNALDTCIEQTEKTGGKRNVHVRAFLQDKDFVLEVEDDGTGMDDATKEKIFEPFFTTKTPEHGTGIGLATVKGIVERHLHGGISFVSAVSEGTIFTVRFPQYALRDTVDLE